MVPANEIVKDTTASGGSFSWTKDGETARLSFSSTSPELVIASSTQVPDAFRGQGVGDALLTAFVADARANGYKIVPLCPFVKAKAQRNPDWADVFA